MYIAELNGKPHLNLIRKCEFELNLIVADPKLELEHGALQIEG